MSHKMETSHTPKSDGGDLRVKRTQRVIQETFIELVVEVGFGAITVQMLAERAMINRATFYRHYEDIYDLVDKVYNNLIDEYLASVQTVMPGDPIVTLQRMFEHCASYAPFYLALLSEGPRFQEIVWHKMEQHSEAFFKRIGLDESAMTMPLPVVLRFWSTAQLGLVQWWLENGQTIPAAEMAQYLWQLYEQGVICQLQLTEQEKPA